MASWVRGRCIGRGSFGTVCLGFHKRTGEVFAVKSVDTASCLPHQIESLENEIRILRSLPPSPHVVAYLRDDVTSSDGPAKMTCRNLHMEYVPGGTAADLAARRGGKFSDVDEAVVRSQARCVVSALQQLHSRGIVHCDVKGTNILVGQDPRSAKLADFGSAIRIGESGDSIAPRGSPLWMAPEVIRGECQGPTSDVWSLGCAVVEMVTGRPPWEDHGVVDTLSRIGYSSEIPEYPAQLSKQGRDFLDKCLRRDPEARWSCDRLLQHPFLQKDAMADSSPRGVLDWVSSEIEEDEEEDGGDEVGVNSNSISDEDVADARARIGKLSSRRGANWESEGWTVVRRNRECEREAEEEAGTSSQYRETSGVELGNGSGIVEYSNFSGMLLATEAQCNSSSSSGDGSEEEGGGGYLAVGEKGMGFYSSRGAVALLLHYYCHCLLRILSRNILLLFCYFTFSRFSSSTENWCVHDRSA
ncbi:mitogen-activated protein kinase kinase kinase 18 isoform X2 [Rhodamnia argentea]|uniref:Mitogen-activated protein kinase kinase kinase 18 isoform X1 n=1 Tax=Rhodamnia argentea TaxID=178133 RepID=A0ABM3HHD0_9MYRT|nr:mitogen-activated protein kinase kinase kinase 18 isoform X1 [Rhodamnia argentea]XP_048136005.1 mitogen-activated protein kinase kinase kinase 18 isoform X2 [Rhodamnia argentea]